VPAEARHTDVHHLRAVALTRGVYRDRQSFVKGGDVATLDRLDVQALEVAQVLDYGRRARLGAPGHRQGVTVVLDQHDIGQLAGRGDVDGAPEAVRGRGAI